ncbi:MAG: aminotransferase class I/II-fold pyridoxal phosphate-dependent enzyme [Gemmatimonadota bacterium]
MTNLRTASRTHGFTESVIREMTRVAASTGALNLAQGFPDFPAPDLLKEAACKAIRDDVNQYAVTWGAASLREELARFYQTWYGMPVDPKLHVTVTCGATEAMAAILLALADPGDEVVVPEPFYENYGPDATLAGARPVFLPLTPPDFHLDPQRLEAVLTPRTRFLILNTPNNPTGRVLTREEAEGVARVARERDLIVVTDEIYEHIIYDGEHLALATLDGMAERTIVVSGLSKTFSVTGWRVGTIVAPEGLTRAIRKVHDFLTVGAPAPLQEACAVGLRELGAPYFRSLATEYRERREVLVKGLQDAGFRCQAPQGAYYVMADFSPLSRVGEDDTAFAHRLSREGGVTPVPGSSFFRPGSDVGKTLARFAFCKRVETLHDAAARLREFADSSA